MRRRRHQMSARAAAAPPTCLMTGAAGETGCAADVEVTGADLRFALLEIYR